MNEYLVVIEHAGFNCAAYAPDLPGCVATGDTREETLQRMREAIVMHLEGIRVDGGRVPLPSSTAEYVAVSTERLCLSLPGSTTGFGAAWIGPDWLTSFGRVCVLPSWFCRSMENHRIEVGTVRPHDRP